MRSVRATRAVVRGTRSRPSSKAEECLFCRLRKPGDDREDLVLARREHAFLMLNRFPYNPAHLMVAVARHAGQFVELTPEERSDLIDLTALAERALAAEYAKRNITVNCVCPGRIGGDRSATSSELPDPTLIPPVGHLGVSEDIAGAVHYFCLPGSSFVTGHTMHVNGGQVLL